jgi:hypothetical protein
MAWRAKAQTGGESRPHGYRLEARFTKRQANIAVQYGEEMRAAGLIDPYIELTEPPAAASRWRPRGYRTRQRDKGT